MLHPCEIWQTGVVINMANVDTRNLEQIFTAIRIMAVVPPMLIVCLALVYQEVGPATLIGVIYAVLALMG